MTKDEGQRTNDPLTSCPTCGCRDLFVRKDFPQKLGLGIVIVAGLGFLILAADRRTFYIGVAVLAAATVVDAVLYWLVPRVTVCYRCRAEYRRLPVNPEHEGFELAVGEKYRHVVSAARSSEDGPSLPPTPLGTGERE